MSGTLTGFATIGVVIAVGFLAAHLGVLDLAAQRVLTRAAFYLANPALMLTVLSSADVARLFSTSALASVGGVLAVAVVTVAVARLVWRFDVAGSTVATLCTSFVNAGNLGLPITAYALGDAALIAPMLLAQLLLFQPVALAVLELSRPAEAGAVGRTGSLGARLLRPVVNPTVVGSAVGVALAATHAHLPPAIAAPAALLGALAVPATLLAYGVSLRLGPRPGSGVEPVQLSTLVALKLLGLPLATYGVGVLLGLSGRELLAVTVIAALPSAQNVFVLATHYQRRTVLARDAVFATTVLSVPVVLGIVGLLV